LQGLPDVVLEQHAVVFGDEPAVGVEVLRTLDGHAHADVGDDVFDSAVAAAASSGVVSGIRIVTALGSGADRAAVWVLRRQAGW
jgi:hypothetical protein